jgi:serine/threonine protein kinase/Flp pilus assembly protein TadD
VQVGLTEGLRCDQCGSPLENDSTTTGCLSCLIAGGLDFADLENRRFQHYEVSLLGDGISSRELGRGAMGITYQAIDLNLGSVVALKVISDRHAEDAGVRERFRREARAAAQLRHPNIASVFHFGETETGQCFYAMEFVEGETLEQRVRRTGPLPTEMALKLCMQVASALVAAESQGLVHRDLKPSNIMVVAHRPSDRDALMVKVIDFGLAKAVSTRHDDLDLKVATFSGTPGFASPEQLKGGDAAIDSRSDIYSLGATLWYLLCGCTPFPTGEGEALPIAQLKAAHVPAPVVLLLQLMLAPEPARRPQTAGALLGLVQSCRHRVEARPRRKKRLTLAALALLLLLISAVALTIYLSRLPHALRASSREKSIAVLPLANLSDDKENGFFADGLLDDILTSLAKISDLKVISRTSVSQYREQAVSRNLREIGRALGVEHVLEGSVRREGNRVLISVQLIDARNDQHIWVERYDRTLADSIGLQGELASQIARALQARLAPEEKARLEEKPTDNAEAYSLYLKGRGREGTVNNSTEDRIAAAQFYSRAIAVDPKFALAHARLSIVNSFIAGWPADDLGRRGEARAAAEEALRLSPTLGESHTALGLCLYWGDKDYAAALQELSTASAISPNEPGILQYIAGIYRRQNRWRESVATFQRAQDLDPRNRWLITMAAANRLMVRDWPAATASYHRVLEIAPDSAHGKIGLAYMEVFRNGNPAAGRKILQNISAGVDPDGLVSVARWDLAMLERDYVTAERILTDFPLEHFPRPGGPPKTFYRGRIALARGDSAPAQRYFAAARQQIEEWVGEELDEPNRHAQLASLYAYMHRSEDAIRESRRALELEPESQNAFHGSTCAANLALVYALVGQPEEAITLIERLLATPGPVAWPDFPSNMTLADLRLRWEWDSLRSNPRFQKILSGPEPKTVVE